MRKSTQPRRPMPGPCEVTAFVKSFSTHTASLRAEAFTTSAHSNTTQLDRAPPDASSPIANEVLQCIASLYAIEKDIRRSGPENVTSRRERSHPLQPSHHGSTIGAFSARAAGQEMSSALPGA